MVVGRVLGDQLTLIDRIKETVRLAGGLKEDGTLEKKTQERALACLERFAQRLHDVPRENVRAVGTNTLRRARKKGDFLGKARERLGVPIEIISGPEEGRLIYLGVSHGVAFGGKADGARLVVDIGGGSTECILGRGFEPEEVDSLHMGCVSWTRRFFPDGEITRDAYRKAELAARVELEPLEERYAASRWLDCVGSSGTINAVHTIVRDAGWSPAGITLAGVKKLRKATIAAGSVGTLSLPGLQADRAPVLPGGLAILRAILETFGVEKMRASDFALREGILYDMLGRIEHEDARERTVRTMMDRYHVDVAQADRVARTALALFDQVAEAWKLDRRARRYLRWSAHLFEVGLAVAYSGYHKHGAYVLENSTLPGFSVEGQALLARLVRHHRRKFPRDAFDDLPPYNRKMGRRVCALLRLAVCLNRRRGATTLPELEARASGTTLELTFPDGWLEEQALTSADLAGERAALLLAGFEFSAA